MLKNSQKNLFTRKSLSSHHIYVRYGFMYFYARVYMLCCFMKDALPKLTFDCLAKSFYYRHYIVLQFSSTSSPCQLFLYIGNYSTKFAELIMFTDDPVLCVCPKMSQNLFYIFILICCCHSEKYLFT